MKTKTPSVHQINYLPYVLGYRKALRLMVRNWRRVDKRNGHLASPTITITGGKRGNTNKNKNGCDDHTDQH